MKVSELEGVLLDFWVGRAAGVEPFVMGDRCTFMMKSFEPSRDWKLGGPIIEREGIRVVKFKECWGAEIRLDDWIDTNDGAIDYTGETPLIAAMRAFVASKFGAVVPDAG